MNPRRTALIVGIVLAVGTAILMYTYLGTAQAHNAAQIRTVVVAARDIPARATIDAAMVKTTRRYGSEVDSDALGELRQAVGHVSLITIPSGSVITRSKVGEVSEFALPRRLTDGLRAVSISIDKVKGVSGLIHPGDRVDVIAVPPRVANETPKATTILRGALVLALGSETETTAATPSPQAATLTTVTLAVTPKQADLLALADVDTTLRLALRPPNEPLRAYATEPLQLGVEPTPAAAAYAPAAPAAAHGPDFHLVLNVPRPAAKPTPAVTIIDGDHVVAADGTGATR